jgi:hypothetical protein
MQISEAIIAGQGDEIRGAEHGWRLFVSKSCRKTRVSRMQHGLGLKRRRTSEGTCSQIMQVQEGCGKDFWGAQSKKSGKQCGISMTGTLV